MNWLKSKSLPHCYPQGSSWGGGGCYAQTPERTGLLNWRGRLTKRKLTKRMPESVSARWVIIDVLYPKMIIPFKHVQTLGASVCKNCGDYCMEKQFIVKKYQKWILWISNRDPKTDSLNHDINLELQQPFGSDQNTCQQPAVQLVTPPSHYANCMWHRSWSNT